MRRSALVTMKGLVSVDLPTRSHDYPTRSHIAELSRMPREGRAGHKTGGVRSAAQQQRTRTRNVQVTWQRVAHIHTHCALSECDTLSSCPNQSHPTSVSPGPTEHYHTFGELEARTCARELALGSCLLPEYGKIYATV